MGVAALAVSIVSALGALYAVWYARRQATAADSAAAASERSAIAAEKTAAVEAGRRQGELTPRFRVSVEPANPGVETLRMTVFLAGPPELGRLDGLTVTIRNDHPWRGQGRPLAGGPKPEQVAAQIWGPYCFTPGTGPGADSVRGIPGADRDGRTPPTGGMPVGEALPFFLEPTRPPSWSQQPLDAWRQQVGTMLRLELQCQREGREPWTVTGEVDTAGGSGTAEIP